MRNRTKYFQSTLGVFQGGGCRAAAFAGAYEIAQQSGVSFVEVAGTSAGSIAAALVAAGASPSQLQEMLMQLDFTKFEAPKTRRKMKGRHRIIEWVLSRRRWAGLDIGGVVFHEGMYSSQYIEDWMEDRLRSVLGKDPGRPVRFKDLPIPLSVIATDISSRTVKIWNSKNTAEESVAMAVRASCSIPIYFQPVAEKYVDGGVLSNLPSFVYKNSEPSDVPLASRVLAFALQADPTQESGHMLSRLADTVVDGNQEIQGTLLGDIPTIRIPARGVKATDFSKMTKEKVEQLIFSGRKAAKEFFEEEGLHVRNSGSNRRIIQGSDELNATLIERASSANELVISDLDSGFVFPLFPMLLHLRLRKVPIIVFLQRGREARGNEAYRQRLLSALGCKLEYTEIRYRAFVFDGKAAHASAFVKPPTVDDDQKAGITQYHAPHDAVVIATLSEALYRGVSENSINFIPRLEQITEKEVISRLRKVSQYSANGTRFSLKTVSTRDLYSLARYGREFKVKQIDFLYQIFRDAGITPFTPATIHLTQGKSIITPPVVELYGDKLLLVEGTSRAIYSRDRGIETFPCIVVENPSGSLPSSHVPLSQVRVIGRTLGPEYRYDGWKYENFRHIESMMHTIDDIS